MNQKQSNKYRRPFFS